MSCDPNGPSNAQVQRIQAQENADAIARAFHQISRASIEGLRWLHLENGIIVLQYQIGGIWYDVPNETEPVS